MNDANGVKLKAGDTVFIEAKILSLVESVIRGEGVVLDIPQFRDTQFLEVAAHHVTKRPDDLPEKANDTNDPALFLPR